MQSAIHSLFQQRRSHYAFAPDKFVSFDDLTALFDAARWAIGYQGEPDDIDQIFAQRDEKPREQKPLSEIILAGCLA